MNNKSLPLDTLVPVAMKALSVKHLLLILAGICSIYYIVSLYINQDDTIESFGHGSLQIVSDLELSVNNLCK